MYVSDRSGYAWWWLRYHWLFIVLSGPNRQAPTVSVPEDFEIVLYIFGPELLAIAKSKCQPHPTNSNNGRRQ